MRPQPTTHQHVSRRYNAAMTSEHQGSDMSDADIAEILQLPIEERLRLVQLIWDSVAADAAAVPPSDAHRAVIDQRVAEHQSNPDDVASREQVLAEARRH